MSIAGSNLVSPSLQSDDPIAVPFEQVQPIEPGLPGDMASDAKTKSTSPRQKLLHESRRAREFYRYYQPIRELTKNGPPLCNLANAAAMEAHRPFSSPDRALTAFCQLGALRLGTRRAMLFFFDLNYAYVLAEATRTLSLQDDSVHEDADDLWLGHTMIPRGYSVCEHTVMLSPPPGSNNPDSKDNHDAMVHIVNDLSEDFRFCDRPFVTGGPRAKFYAGVPITTPKGINIGAYCVLDDKKREGLDEAGMQFLRDMSTTVMTHLEMVRAQAEHRIGTQMVAGLGAFIDGASGFQDWADQNADWNKADGDYEPANEHPLGPQPGLNSASAVAQAAVAVTESSSKEHQPTLSSSGPRRQRSRTLTSSNGSSVKFSANTSSTLKSKRSTDDIKDPAATNIQKTFERAATLIREAMDVEGVMFLDAAVSTFGGLVDTIDSVDNTELSSDNVGSASELTGTGTEGEDGMRSRRVYDEDNAPKQCHVLASSCVTPAGSTAQHEFTTKQHALVTEKFLRSLLRRYPRGKTWSFNEHGDASSDDESEHSTDAKSCRCLPNQSDGGNGHSPACSRRKKRNNRIDDAKEILRLFPGVRSLGLVGMWDHTRQRWYAACVFWTYSPLRLFSEESEVKYMSAFCDVILAELHRLEAQTSDKAKSDFISTMSHELRSPLHGILGSVECLQEQPTDSISSDLISQVDICGRTLLDIIDHLLDFSKINHHAKARTGVLIDARGRRISTPAAKSRSRMGGMMTLSADIALDHVTEEVVETAVYSFCCSRDPGMILKRKVAVILDIDKSSHIDWSCHVAVGAWKRICINLVSNALKYTSEGHIKISLKASPIPDKKKRFNVTLSVSDTGRGMSRDFLENHLFRAFEQEDSFVEGTGLGMNLVAKIVKAFEGKIDVQSEKGKGTSFSVTLPLEHSRPGREVSQKSAQRAIDRSLVGVSVGIIESSTGHSSKPAHVDTSRGLLISSIHKTLDEAGANAIKSDWSGRISADVYIVTEAEVQQEIERLEQKRSFESDMDPAAFSNCPIVVLCESALSARKLRAIGLGVLASEHIEVIAQPAGPERITKSISLCLQSKRAVDKATTIAGAVKDIPAMVPHPDPDVMQQPLSLRQRPLSREKAWHFERRLGEVKEEGMQESSETEAARPMSSAKLERGLSSDAKFPRIPTPNLNGSKPRLGYGMPKQIVPPPAKPQAEEGAEAEAPISLLLVDDNPINLQLLVTYATKFGHHKTVATDGLQAVEAYRTLALERNPSRSNSTSSQKLSSSPPQSSSSDQTSPPPPPTGPIIILMDINMPILNGFEASRQIRGFEQQRGIPPATIIALTGLGSADAQKEAFSSGVDLFLTKPVRLKELTKILEGVRKG